MTAQPSYRRISRLMMAVLLLASASYFVSAGNAEAKAMVTKVKQVFKVTNLNAYESLSVTASGGHYWNTRTTPSGVQRVSTCSAKIDIRERHPIRHLLVPNGTLKAQVVKTTVKGYTAVVRYQIARGSCIKGAPLPSLIKVAKLQYDNIPSLIEAIGSPVRCNPVAFDRSRSIQPCGDLF